MKKLALLATLGILLAASVTPAFAKGQPPKDPNQNKAQGIGMGLQKGDGTANNPGLSKGTPPGLGGDQPQPPTNPGKGNGNGKPSGSDENPGKGPKDNPGKSHKPDGGKNFVLFGTVDSITGDIATITVKSGNHLMQGVDSPIKVDISSAVIWVQGDGNSPDDRDHKTPAVLKTGDMVWVHGWWTAPKENTSENTTSITTTDDKGTYTARQVKILDQIPTDEQESEE